MMNNNKDKTPKRKLPSVFYTVGRTLFGGLVAKEKNIADERYASPSKLAVKRFFRKPLATGAVILLCAMFLFVLIGPIFDPVDLSYQEDLHANVAPNMDMMDIPSGMKKDPVSISSWGSFTIGLNEKGKVYVWGYYKTFSDKARKDVMKIPAEVKQGNMLYAAAGYDHCVTIDSNGKIYAWGEDDNAQYGREGRMLGDYPQPDELIFGTLDTDNIAQLICGYQMTAILMKDGGLYAWGNTMAGASHIKSMLDIAKDVKFKKICFTNSDLFAISEDGEFIRGKNNQYEYYKSQDIDEYIGQRKAVDIAATGDSIVILLDDGELLAMGTEKNAPALPEGEKIASISAGARHFSLVTESGSVISWGNGKLGQTDTPSKLEKNGSADTVFSSGFQNYAFKDGKFVDSWGLKGYLFGTDNMGRDVFNRVMNGGKMTMTIGAVAVIVSSIIGIIIGCIAGYFGGWVDLLLMRVTEIFSAIPFLPFALVLSAVLQGSSLKEDYRIFIIMIILGLLSWTGLATLVRGQILAEREKEFVIAAKAMGVKERKIAFRHILPNVISVILVSLTLNFATCMLTESSLSYLGFGVRLPRPTWGNMLDGCRNSIVIQHYWWRWLFPSIFLAVTVICINIIGDTLRDVLDPKSEVEK